MTTPTYSPSVSQGYYLNNLVSLAQYLMQHGYSAAAAAGVAGAVAGESGGNPESQGSGGAGLIAWTPPSKATPNYPIVTGNAETDFENQLVDIIEYNNQQGQSALQNLNTATDPVSASDIYSQQFERPLVTDSDVRPQVAQYVYAAVQGQPTTGILGSGNSNVTLTSANTTTTNPGLLGLLTSPLSGVVPGLASGVSNAFGTSSFKDLLIRGGLIILGGLLVIVGIIIMSGREISSAMQVAGVPLSPGAAVGSSIAGNRSAAMAEAKERARESQHQRRRAERLQDAASKPRVSHTTRESHVYHHTIKENADAS